MNDYDARGMAILDSVRRPQKVVCITGGALAAMDRRIGIELLFNAVRQYRTERPIRIPSKIAA